MRTSRVWAVLGLSALLGSGWLLTEAYPSELPSPIAGCLHFTVIGLAGLLVTRATGWSNFTWRRAALLSLVGLGLFVLPGMVGQLVGGAVSSSAFAALFCAVPLLIVLGTDWFGVGSGRSLMLPTLLGLLGALLIFTVEVPTSIRRAVCLVAVFGCCVVTAGMSVWMFKLMQGIRTASAVMVVGFVGAAVLGVDSPGAGGLRVTPGVVGMEAARCLVFDLPVVWITLWLMRDVPPPKLAARFLIAPVVTWLEGYAFVRGPVEVRSIVALILMALGAAVLMLNDESDEVPGLQLR